MKKQLFFDFLSTNFCNCVCGEEKKKQRKDNFFFIFLFCTKKTTTISNTIIFLHRYYKVSFFHMQKK